LIRSGVATKLIQSLVCPSWLTALPVLCATSINNPEVAVNLTLKN